MVRVIDNNRPADIRPVRTTPRPTQAEPSPPQEETQNEQQRRIGICKACEHYSRGRCRKCGCFMQLKTRLKNSHCPIGKW